MLFAGVCRSTRRRPLKMSACAGSNADDARVQKAEVNRRTVLLRFGLSIWATVHPGLARIRRWGGLSRVCDPHPGRTRGKGQPTDSDQRAPSTRHRASVSRPTACTAIPLAREHRRVRVPQVAKAALGLSPALRQTPGKRTSRSETALDIALRSYKRAGLTFRGLPEGTTPTCTCLCNPPTTARSG